jgi:hypothetical protein
VRRGRLEIGGDKGVEVHAASFARKREVVLDRALAASPLELKRVVAHELFHFVWLRMNNRQRREWGDLLRAERSSGELGWSAEWRRRELSGDDARMNTRRWREYASESFSDTGAWFASGGIGDPDRLLGSKWIGRRKRFMAELKSHWNGVWRI